MNRDLNRVVACTNRVFMISIQRLQKNDGKKTAKNDTQNADSRGGDDLYIDEIYLEI